MTNALSCKICGWLGDDPDTRSEREFDGLDREPYRISTYDVCPACGGEDMDDVEICDECQREGIYKIVTVEDGARCREHADTASDDDEE